MTQLLTLEQVADLLQVSITQVRRLCYAGELKHMRHGKVYRVRPSDVEEYVEAHMR